MAEYALGRTTGYRALYVGLVTLVVFYNILPLGLSAGQLPGPDLVMALTIAWVMRRPEYVPVLLVAIVMLAADFMMMRPPGVHSALVIISLELLRARTARTRTMPPMIEWGAFAVLALAVMTGERVIMAIAMLPQLAFLHDLAGTAFTVLIYPLVAFASQALMGVRRVTPGETDAQGRWA